MLLLTLIKEYLQSFGLTPPLNELLDLAFVCSLAEALKVYDGWRSELHLFRFPNSILFYGWLNNVVDGVCCSIWVVVKALHLHLGHVELGHWDSLEAMEIFLFVFTIFCYWSD